MTEFLIASYVVILFKVEAINIDPKIYYGGLFSKCGSFMIQTLKFGKNLLIYFDVCYFV